MYDFNESYEVFIEKLGKTVRNQCFPPRYNPEEWEGIQFNCYLYAMNACKDMFHKHGWSIEPGFIAKGKTNPFYTHTEKWIVENFIADFGQLGLKVFPTSMETKLSSDSYKIAVYVWENQDYHFARQDADGGWSEKIGWNHSISRLTEKEVCQNRLDNYTFIGIFGVQKAE